MPPLCRIFIFNTLRYLSFWDIHSGCASPWILNGDSLSDDDNDDDDDVDNDNNANENYLFFFSQILFEYKRKVICLKTRLRL